jgi:hypothetical protein
MSEYTKTRKITLCGYERQIEVFGQKIKGKAKTNRLKAWAGLEGSRKLVRLSALGTGRLYPPGNTPGAHFCYRLSQPQGHISAGRIMSMKNSSDTIRNRIRDLPDCSVVPQPLRHRVPRLNIRSDIATYVALINSG